MTGSNKITSGQNVHPDKLAFAKRLRREMTPAERRLWRALRRSALDGFHFRRQQVIEGYIADFYCDAAKLVIELEGGVHQEQWRYDESRDQAITSIGFVFSEFRMMRCSTLRRLLSISGRRCGRAEKPDP
jgi:very-short-patch-repair endonuclease